MSKNKTEIPTIITKFLFGKSYWYSFENIDQTNSYVTIGSLNCGTDKKALKTAKEINPSLTYTIQEMK